MPQFIAGFTAFFTGATVAGVGATIGTLFAAATFNAALGAISRKLTSKKESPSGRSQQREVTVRATDAYDVFVYGRALVGGVTVYHNGIPDGSGVNNRMHHVVKWAGHECASIELFRLDDRTLDPATSSIDWSPRSYNFVGDNGLVQAGEFRGVTTASGPTYLRWYLGDQKSADLRLVGQADEWTSAHIGRDQTYGILEVWQVDEGDQTSKVYQKGFPGNIAALLHGKKIYDHRRYALNRDPSFSEMNSWWFGNTALFINSFYVAGFGSWELARGVGGQNDQAAQLIGAGIEQKVGDRLFTEQLAVDPSSAYTLTFMARMLEGDAQVRPYVQEFMTDGTSASNTNFGFKQFTSIWSRHYYTFGAGTANALSSSARIVHVGLYPITSATLLSNIQIQDFAVYLGTGSRHLIDVSSTWEYSESPPFCVADYMKDEKLGFGKRLRIPVNPSRYALNGDPTWRKRNTLSVGTYWRTDQNSGSSTPLGSLASLTTVTGAPVGRRALVMVASDGSSDFANLMWSDMFPVDPSGYYTVSVRAKQDDSNSTNFLAVNFLDANGAFISPAAGDAVGWISPSSFWHNFATVVTFPSVWSTYTTDMGSGSASGRSIPSSARYMCVGGSFCREPTSDTAVYLQEYMVHVGTQIRHFIEPHEQIFWPSVSSAAAYTDAIVSTPSGTQVRFACNGAGHTGRGHRENIRDLLSSFNGRAVYVQSGFWITAGWEEPTKTLNKSDFRNGAALKIRAQAEREDRYNHVRGTFFDPVQEFKSVPFATVTADEYIARDSSQQLFHDLNLPFTNDWFMAQRVAFGVLEQGDNQQLVEFQLKHSALDLMPGRVVGITHDVVSWTNHTLRMVDMRTDLKKGVTLFGREDYQASYADPSTSDYYARNFTGVTSHAPVVPQISSATATYLGRDGVYLEWRNPGARSFEWVDIYRRLGTNAFSGSTLIKSVRANQYLDAVNSPGNAYYYWFRTRDFANNVSSVFPGLTTSVSAIPALPQVSSVRVTYLGRSGIQLDWANPDDRQFEAIDIYRRVGGTNAFSGSTLIKSTRNTQFLDGVSSLSAAYHYWFRARDFAGNAGNVYPGLATSFSVIPGVPFVSSVTIGTRLNGVQLRWVNPDNRQFEWIDIYRRATNAFSGSTLIKSTRNDEYFDSIATGSMGITNYYWFRTRDFADNVSSVFPGLTTSHFATPNFAVAQDPEYVFLDEFRYENIEQFEEQWERVALTGGNASISFPGSGTLGGKVIRANSGEAWYTSKTRIPYDPQALYQMTVKTRMTTSHSQRAQYFGFTGYRADGTTPIATNSSEAFGGQHFFVRQNHSPSSLNVWDEHVGHVRGYMPWPNSGTVNANVSQDPKLAAHMHDLVRYVSPLFILNFDDGAGAQEIDYISVRKIVPRGSLVFDPQVTLENNWLVMSGVGSRDLVNGTVVDFRGQSVNGEFNVIALPVSASISQTAFLERARPEYHDFFTHTNTITFNWRAQVYVESRDTFVTVAPYVALYTRSGSGAQFHTATGQVFGLASSGWTPFDAWQGINLPITVSPGFINQNSFPPPYFISVGATISFTGSAGTVKAYFAEIGANYS